MIITLVNGLDTMLIIQTSQDNKTFEKFKRINPVLVTHTDIE